MIYQPAGVAARSKTGACDRSLARIAGSNPDRTWESVSCECCVLSGRVLCDELIISTEESYQVRCV